jgi:hypothetical protein
VLKGKFYLAGPMTGIPQFNYPTFHAAAKILREKGLTIASPAEMDTPEQQEVALASTNGAIPSSGFVGDQTWGMTLGKDIAFIADEAAGIIALPGWNKSKGARLEVTCANLLKKPVYEFDLETQELRLMDKMVMNCGLLGFPLTAKLAVEI